MRMYQSHLCLAGAAQPPERDAARHPLNDGFSLMEVLVALAIFAIGFVAVAAIFPAGALLQRNAATDILARNVTRNAQAIVEATALSYSPGNIATDGDSSGNLKYYHSTTSGDSRNTVATPQERSDVRPFNDTTGTDSGNLDDLWTLADRSYPSTIADPTQRDLYWVPMIRDKNGDENNPTWQLFIFVLSREDGQNYNPAGYTGTPPGNQRPPLAPGLDGLGTSPAWASDDLNSIPSVTRLNVTIGTSSGGKQDRFNFTNNYTDPKNGKTFHILDIGDWLLYGSRGIIYRVVDSDNSGVTVDGVITDPPDVDPAGTAVIWYAPAAVGEDNSPCQKIIAINNLAIDTTP